MMYKALRSAGGFRHPLRSLTRIEQNADEADREVHDFRCKLTTCNRQELHAPRKQPGRRMHVCTKYIEKGRRERAVLYLIEFEIKANPSHITPAKLLREELYTFVGREKNDFSVRFENSASCVNARRHGGSRQLCLPACVVVL